MKRLAFLFPGQGSQAVGMGIALCDAYPQAAAIFDMASDIAGYDLYELCAQGPLDKLSRTSFTQPALFTTEVALIEALRANGIEPGAVAGHSLGEFAAWYAAGVFSFEDGFMLVSERGRLMENVDPEGNGSMAAVMGLDLDVVRTICDATPGTVVVANFNSPQQVVISGEKTAIQAASVVLTEKGAKRVLPLKVSGAFHSPLMAGAQDQFAAAVEEASLNDAQIPVYANVTAAPVTDAAEIKALMVEQLISPVRWVETVIALTTDGISEALEVGPGNVLTGLVKRIDEHFTVVPVSDETGIQGVLDGTA